MEADLEIRMIMKNALLGAGTFLVLLGSLWSEEAAALDIDHSRMALRQIAFDGGRTMVSYAIDDKKSVVYVVVCPVSPNEGFSTKPDLDRKEGHVKASIQYRGLSLSGPCACQSLVVCDGDSVTRAALKPCTEPQLLDLVKKSADISRLEAGLKVEAKKTPDLAPKR